MFILNSLFRAESQEQILIFLFARESGYAREIADFYDIRSPAVIQKQLLRLEDDGVVVGKNHGRTRMYQFNPRFVFLEPLKSMLKTTLELYPKEVRSNFLMVRGRPRANRKAINYLGNSE